MPSHDEEHPNARGSAAGARKSYRGQVCNRSHQAKVAKRNELRTGLLEVVTLTEASGRKEQEVRVYMDLIENAPIGFLVLQGETIEDAWALRIVSANRAVFEISGRMDMSAGDVIGHTIAVIFPSVCEGDLAASCLSVIRSQQPERIGEIHFGEPHEERRFFSIHAFPLAHDYVGIALENITEHKRAEHKLRTAEAKLHWIGSCD